MPFDELRSAKGSLPEALIPNPTSSRTSSSDLPTVLFSVPTVHLIGGGGGRGWTPPGASVGCHTAVVLLATKLHRQTAGPGAPSTRLTQGAAHLLYRDAEGALQRKQSGVLPLPPPPPPRTPQPSAPFCAHSASRMTPVCLSCPPTPWPRCDSCRSHAHRMSGTRVRTTTRVVY